MIKGEVPFKTPFPEGIGRLEVGVTNQKINKNNEPTEEVTDQWTLFGKARCGLN